MAIGLRLIAKLASPAHEPELLKAIADWVQQKFPEVVPEIKQARVKEAPALFCKLHPAAEEVELTLVDPEHLVASASTSSVGPGYHIFVVSLLKDWARDFHALWQQPDDESGEYGDETGYFFQGDRQLVFKSMTTWLQNVAKLFFDGTLDPKDTGIALSMPAGAHFESDQLAVTPLGPRSREWAYQTSQDGAAGRDFFAWWTPGLNAEYYLGRALTLMWSSVRWRPPVIDAEMNVLKTVADSLSLAHKLDPRLGYPWAEWKEILDLLDADRPEKDLVLPHASGKPTLGYRRANVTVTLTGGWRVRIDGSFSEFGFNQDNDLYALDPPREIWFTPYRMPAPLTNEQFDSTKRHMQDSQPNHFAEGEHYAATATISKKVRDSGEEYFAMNTLNVAPAAKAVCTLIYPHPEDEEWALEVWKSLRPPASRKSKS